MSFDLAFWRSDSAPDVAAAAEIYDKLTDGLSGVVAAAAPIIDDFYSDIIAVYPEITPENMDVSPWATSLYRTGECLIAAVSWSRRDEVAPVLLGLARKHGLIAYDPQDQVVHSSFG